MNIVACLFHLAFFKAPLQAVADGEASLRQEVVQHFGGEGLPQRFQTCLTRLSTEGDTKREREVMSLKHLNSITAISTAISGIASDYSSHFLFFFFFY